jgi:antitoxin ParD1/3/4
MATMNVSLPHALKAIVDDRVASGEYASASDYVRDLIRKDADAKRKWAEFDSLIKEGLNSPISERSFEEVMEGALEEARRRGAPD